MSSQSTTSPSSGSPLAPPPSQSESEFVRPACERYQLDKDEEVWALVDFLRRVQAGAPELAARPQHYNSPLLARFLIGRKWNADKALSSLVSFAEMADRCNIFSGEIGEQERDEISRGKMEFVRDDDGQGRTVAFMRTERHFPGEYPIEQTMRLLIFTILHIMDTPRTVRGGLVVVVDMSSAGLANFSIDERRRLFDLIQHRLPARIARLYVLDPPWVLSVILRIISAFLKQKLRDRICRMRRKEILSILPTTVLPTWLGGAVQMHPEAMLEAVIRSAKDLGGL